MRHGEPVPHVVSGPYDPLADYENWGYNHFQTMVVTSEDKDKMDFWKDNNLDTVGLNPCVREVLEKLLSANNLIGRILTKIDRANGRAPDLEKFKLKFRTGTLANAAGETSTGSINSNIYSDTITIDSHYADSATQVSVARTLAHEIIHAYLNSIFKRYYNIANPNSIPMDSIFTTYIDTLEALHTRQNLRNWVYGPLRSDFHHNFMADKLMETFANVLAYVDDNRNSDEFYWCLSWGGLMKTKAMRKYWPNHPTWLPTSGYPAISNDSTGGLKYALTQARLDSMRWWYSREVYDTAHAKGRRHQSTGCY